MPFLEQLERHAQQGTLDDKLVGLIRGFYQSYCEAGQAAQLNQSTIAEKFELFLKLIVAQVQQPHTFSHHHHSIRTPLDYYSFGIEMFRPLVLLDKSVLRGTENLDRMLQQLEDKENVILLANHQTELDPQAISLLLEEDYAVLGERLNFIAGDRVLIDPMAVPFSLGRNLFCIYSKRYINDPPEQKADKQRHNQRTMRVMQESSSQGGRAIYVAPSGGRDRPNADGKIEVTAFDPSSLEMLILTSIKAKRPAHFYPLALRTYHLLPPPDRIVSALGEWRQTAVTPIHAHFGDEIAIEQFPKADSTGKRERRTARASYIEGLVRANYEALPEQQPVTRGVM